ncbi:adenosylcobinamide-phosphate synthase CbiB [Bacillus solimangrovi]|uniref:Cobalamin biosynthesis protein CobD n=1 Tax=Bacillus solimangrovi TaxID=1305675 RepID=A0A1E5LHG6_9BACI|nr:adenosylcobinamide-phosphate synthase CbiB [Bacillus solimangrovi]OEH93519.1 cobalamin biosynthesis protein CobD [Bacillus solimangrovi]
MINHLISICFALVLDRLFGDPEHLPHPVRYMGTLISKLDKSLNIGKYRKVKGIVTVLIVSIVCFGFAYCIVQLSVLIHPSVAILVEGFLIYTTIAMNDLERAARRVETPLMNGDMLEARDKLGWIVGRDTTHLNESEIVRGTVETVSENTSDGITASLFYAAIGGAPLAFLYRAVNTCDAMLGYKNEKYYHFGWAAARFDDLLNFIPSRMTGLLMIIVNASGYQLKTTSLLKQLSKHAKNHPSPNSGWCEAATALLLRVQLGGQNTYHGQVSNRPLIGVDEVQLQTKHINETIQIMKRTTYYFFILLAMGVILYEQLIT